MRGHHPTFRLPIPGWSQSASTLRAPGGLRLGNFGPQVPRVPGLAQPGRKRAESLPEKADHYRTPALVPFLPLLSLKVKKKNCCRRVRREQGRGHGEPEASESLHKAPAPPSLSPDRPSSSLLRWVDPGSALFNIRIGFKCVLPNSVSFECLDSRF